MGCVLVEVIHKCLVWLFMLTSVYARASDYTYLSRDMTFHISSSAVPHFDKKYHCTCNCEATSLVVEMHVVRLAFTNVRCASSTSVLGNSNSNLSKPSRLPLFHHHQHVSLGRDRHPTGNSQQWHPRRHPRLLSWRSPMALNSEDRKCMHTSSQGASH